ncbi:hypothetical protein I7I50_06514 [Histoplasma capsulatum G186AR]|uniref:Uncharacterized protein n=1 Tax=Ajellomyces capsulatus TaxID=5037 RepID=A0A8H7YWN1_AJECA|nr:hypothetical protein I7I52_10413 [Histoplasma capsulatum]QSS67435.1 hypothetical protein I7I50_06514 [Histoplasma capsulatum G186AR]
MVASWFGLCHRGKIGTKSPQLSMPVVVFFEDILAPPLAKCGPYTFINKLVDRMVQCPCLH